MMIEMTDAQRDSIRARFLLDPDGCDSLIVTLLLVRYLNEDGDECMDGEVIEIEEYPKA